MIHTFKAVGQPMLLDVGSGAVHAIDDLAYDVLEKWNESTPEEIKATPQENTSSTSAAAISSACLLRRRSRFSGLQI